MTKTVEELGCNGVQILVGGGLGGAGWITAGRTFTVNVDGVGAAQGGFLALSGFGIAGSVSGTSGYQVNWDSGFYTLYTAPIPSPGAALLAPLAGMLLRRRRRR